MTDSDIRAIEAHLDVLLERYEAARREVLQAMCRRLVAVEEGPHSALANAIRLATGEHFHDIDVAYRAKRDALNADLDDVRAVAADYFHNVGINVQVEAYAETLRRFNGDPVRLMTAERSKAAGYRRLADALKAMDAERQARRLRDEGLDQ